MKAVKQQEILLFNEERWTLRFINAAGTQRSVTWIDAAKCVRTYLKYGNGSCIYRLISILKRAFTRSLKPRQVFPSG